MFILHFKTWTLYPMYFVICMLKSYGSMEHIYDCTVVRGTLNGKPSEFESCSIPYAGGQDVGGPAVVWTKLRSWFGLEW